MLVIVVFASLVAFGLFMQQAVSLIFDGRALGREPRSEKSSGPERASATMTLTAKVDELLCVVIYMAE